MTVADPFRSLTGVRTPSQPVALDLSDDGSLLAVACHDWKHGCRVLVARTGDGATVDSFGEGFHRVAGVALAGDALYFLGVLGDYQGPTSLYRRDLRAKSHAPVADLGSNVNYQGMARDRAGLRLALLHDDALVYDLTAGRVAHTLPGTRQGPMFACFAPHRPWLYLQGVEERALVAFDLTAGVTACAWPAPSRTAGPVATSPSGRYVCIHGVNNDSALLLDLADGSVRPMPGEHFSASGPWAFTPDGGSVVHAGHSSLALHALPDLAPAGERELSVDPRSARWATAWDGPVMALSAGADTVAVVTLSPGP